MSIRREDKELIHNLAVLSALLGACLGVFAVIHLSSQAQEQSRRHNEYQQTHAALAKLSSPKGVSGELVVDQAVIKQMQEQIQLEEPEAVEPQQSFWLRIPRWGLWGLCGASGIVGAVAAFSTIWLTGWAGSAFIYYFIRILYKIIRKTAPNSAAAAKLNLQSQLQNTGQPVYQRNDDRVLPVLVKLIFLLILVLGVLGAVVWQLAGLS